MRTGKYYRLILLCALLAAACSLYAVPRVVDTISLQKGAAVDGPVPIAVDKVSGKVFIAGANSGNIVKYDPALKRVDGEIKGISNPENLILEDNKLYLTAGGASGIPEILIYDAGSLALLKSIPLPEDYYVYCLALDSSGNKLYYGVQSRIKIIDLSQEGVLPRVFIDLNPVKGPYVMPLEINLDKARNRFYLTLCYWDSVDYTFNSAFVNYDAAQQQVSGSVYLGRDVFSFDAVFDGTKVYIAQMYANAIAVVDVETNRLTNIQDVSWPQRLALNPEKKRLYAVDNFTDKFHIIDTENLTLVKSFVPGDDPSGVCYDPSRSRAYTANYWSDDAAVVDTGSESLLERIPFSPATPLDIKVDTVSGKAYVSNGPNGGIFVIDTEKRTLIDKILPFTYSDSGLFTFASGLLNVYTGRQVLCGNKLYTIDEFNKSLAVFDLAEEKFVKHIGAGEIISGIAGAGGKVYCSYIQASKLYLGMTEGETVDAILLGDSGCSGGVDVNPATNKAYIADTANNQVVVLDLALRNVIKRINVINLPGEISINREINIIYVSNRGSDSVGVIDGETDELMGYIPVGKAPSGIESNPATGRVYVVNSGDNSVSVICGYTNLVEAVLPVGNGAKYCGFDASRSLLYVPNQEDGTITIAEDPPDITPPVITHEPVAGPRPEKTKIAIECAVTDENTVVSAELYYRNIAAGAWSKITLVPAGGDIYSADIPAVDVLADKIEYYISARDNWNNSARTGVYEIEIEGQEGTARAWITVPQDGKRVRGNAVTMVARSTENTEKVKFQYRKNNLVKDLVMPVDGKIKVTLTKASAVLVSDVYICSPLERLLIENNLVNTGITVEGEYSAGTRLNFFIRTDGSPLGFGIYDHYADSGFCSIKRMSLLKWQLGFEDLPENHADWDYNDAVLVVEIIPDGPVTDEGSQWIDIGLDEKSPWHVYWNTSVLQNGAYDLRAMAYDETGLPDPAPETITVYIDDVNADIAEDGNPDAGPDNYHRVEQKIDPVVNNFVVTADGTEAYIPQGSFNTNTTMVIESLPPSAVPVPSAGSVVKPLGVYRKYEMSDGTRVFNNNIVLSIPYPDADGDGIVDGTSVSQSEIRVMYLNESGGEWVDVSSDKAVSAAGYASLSGTGKGTGYVSVKVNHFTIFGLFYYAGAEDLGGVMVYPNPFKPYEGDTKITFDGLTQNVKLGIYTVSGKPVKELVSAEGGKLDWDVTSADGNAVPSGVYFYAVTNDKGARKTGKLAILR